MLNERGVVFNIGDRVKYQMPVDDIDIGTVKRIDGYDVYVEFTLEPETYVIHRYSNEILECLSTSS